MSNSIVPYTELTSIASAMAKSGYFQDAGSAEKALVKIVAGQELGLGPFAAMSGIHIISGKPVMGANLLATLIENDPRYAYQVLELTAEKCAIRFYKAIGQELKETGVSEFTIQDAKKAGSKNLDKFPRNMLFARAISNGARWFAPGVFGGSPVYTPDEMNLDMDEDGQPVIIQAEVRDVKAKAPQVQVQAQASGMTDAQVQLRQERLNLVGQLSQRLWPGNAWKTEVRAAFFPSEDISDDQLKAALDTMLGRVRSLEEAEDNKLLITHIKKAWGPIAVAGLAMASEAELVSQADWELIIQAVAKVSDRDEEPDAELFVSQIAEAKGLV